MILSVKSELDEKIDLLSSQIKTVQSREFDLRTMTSQYGTLTKIDDTLEGYREGVKTIMNLPGGDEVFSRNGIKGMTADLIEAETG